jgi:hypothetical protein
VIDLYRRDLQRAYVKLLVSSLASSESPSEFRVACALDWAIWEASSTRL